MKKKESYDYFYVYKGASEFSSLLHPSKLKKELVDVSSIEIVSRTSGSTPDKKIIDSVTKLGFVLKKKGKIAVLLVKNESEKSK